MLAAAWPPILSVCAHHVCAKNRVCAFAAANAGLRRGTCFGRAVAKDVYVTECRCRRAAHRGGMAEGGGIRVAAVGFS